MRMYVCHASFTETLWKRVVLWESIPGWHAKGVPKVTPMMTAAGMDSRKTVEIHCLFAKGRGWKVSELATAFITLA